MPAGLSAGTIAAIGASAAAAGSSIYSATQSGGSGISGTTGLRGQPTFLLNTPSMNLNRTGPFTFSSDQPQGITDTLDSLKAGVGQANDAINANLASLTPGFGAITQARVDAIHNAALKATSDLQGNLAKRRVLGSSFGQNAVAQVAQQEGVDTANAKAQSYLDELNATNNLINTRLNNINSLVTQELGQANFETTAGINLVNGTQQVFGDNAAVIGQLAAANAAGAGAGLQTALNGSNGQPGLIQLLRGLGSPSATPAGTLPTGESAGP
jgi:hypothetical protein